VTWQPYLISLGAGLGIGVIYGLIAVRSPAPPIIALLGLLGMLAGEAAVQWIRGHSDAVAQAFHLKSFAVTHAEKTTEPPKTETL
jgi:XapX domain-containing protein